MRLSVMKLRQGINRYQQHAFFKMEDKRETQTQIDDILNQTEEQKKLGHEATEVFKEAEPIIDVGNLLLSDQQPISLPEFRSNSKYILENLARDNAQLLFNEIWKLPVDRFEDVIVAKLPAPTTIIPREKPIPKPKPPTKWELYAKKKGIEKKKRERMVWDEVAKEWKPRFGHKRANDSTDKWLIEVPDQADPFVDQFEKLTKEKKEKVAKNELQRLRNIARNKKGGSKILNTELKPTAKKDQERITKEIDITRASTASLGKFQRRLPKEKKTNERKGVKRKFDMVSGNTSAEKEKALEIWNKMQKPDVINTQKASNRMIAQQDAGASRGKGKGKRGPGSKVKNRVFKQKKTNPGNVSKKGKGKNPKHKRSK